MEHEMRKEMNKFKDFLKENSEEKLNISDVSESFSEWNQIWKKFALENHISASPDYQKGLMDLRNWLEKNFEVPLNKNSH